MPVIGSPTGATVLPGAMAGPQFSPFKKVVTPAVVDCASVCKIEPACLQFGYTDTTSQCLCYNFVSDPITSASSSDYYGVISSKVCHLDSPQGTHIVSHRPPRSPLVLIKRVFAKAYTHVFFGLVHFPLTPRTGFSRITFFEI